MASAATRRHETLRFASSTSHRTSVSSNCGMVELIEAAARSGRPEAALGAQRRLVDTTEICGTDWALGIQARSSALLAGDASAEELHVEAIERLQRSTIRVELAR